ncbi:hypothetical protein RJ639_030612 [Escallonia herrerae]|uniref:CASP-like protein n=1 Tax=Escallonia herrerae TaxID=1293975 RepID=A0AA89BNT8_9ASTE|nr:hypothetical protein RJ639_030612 [Escallonia herrerae]
MSVSRPAVHPLEAPPPTDGAAVAPPHRVRMKDVQGMPGTSGGLVLRVCQLILSAVSLSVMASTSDFPSVTAFRYLVAAVSLQSFWSLTLAVVDVYALLVGRSLQSPRVASLFTIGDGITSTLMFAAASASAGITAFIVNDLDCDVNHCGRFTSATAMAFMCWFAVSPSFLLNFWSLASR